MGFKGWMTPRPWFELVNERYQFTLDAAASHHDHLLPLYSTLEGTYKAGALIDTRDGLSYPWEGQRVFCNPPYDDTLGRWVDRLLSHEATLVMMLLPPSVDTTWFARIDDASMRNEASFWFYRGRMRFSHPALMPGTVLADEQFDHAALPVLGPSPRAGNLIVVAYR